jgi:lipoic acid synthetase
LNSNDDSSKKSTRMRKPEWLKVRACGNGKYLEVLSLIRENNLHTVCQEANCPNRGECFSSGTATFLIMGPNCTRNCRFCNVVHGRVAPLDGMEPRHVARAVSILNLKHAVVTSVTRDDLPDGGAGHFARVIAAIREACPETTIEVLTPDFKGRRPSLLTVFEAAPDVFNHNVETIPRLYPQVRPRADYERSLNVLKAASDYGGLAVKSGLMVGLGETSGELAMVFRDLKGSGVEFLTIGQYLAPSPKHHPVIKYYSPAEFEELAAAARQSGINSVFSAPLVRSSYHAGEKYHAQ